jgi:hypothetical protein
MAETVLGTGAGFAAALASVALLLTVPVRWRIDTLGVHRARGVVPWLHYHDPADSFRAVLVYTARFQEGNRRAHVVRLVRRAEAARPLHVRGFPDKHVGPGGDVEDEAVAFASQVGLVLGLAVERGGR